jgi:cytochrome c553
MKKIMTNKITLALAGLMMAAAIMFMNGCKASQAVLDKSGAQLWGENCRRCHNAPDPNTFSAEQWVTIGLHMQSRALLTDQERDKIVEFLKQ